MLKLSSGKSEKDRISFYTSDNEGATAIRNPSGEITIKYEKNNIPIAKAIIAILVLFGTLSLVKAFVLIPLIEKGISTIWYLVPAFFYSFLAVTSIISVRKTGGKEFLQNHGAEHKVYTAYLKLGRIPTVEEASKFSRINKSCGVTIYSAYITAQLIGFIVYINSGFIIPELLLFVAPIIMQSVFPFNFLGLLAQFFTTAQPEASNIQLAIAAVTALELK